MSGPDGPSPTPVDFVIDASVALKWFVTEVHGAEARRFLDAGIRGHVPTQLFGEVANALWRKVHFSGEIAADQGRAILRTLLAASLQVHPTTPPLGSAFDIAVASGRTVYDSLYLALALSLGCKLVTADQKLYNALQGGPLAGTVHWVADPI
jgi:predicted nucleic acid-binding protein